MKITTLMTVGLLALTLGACGGEANVGSGGGGSGASGGEGGSGASGGQGGSGGLGGAGGQGGNQGGAGQGGGSGVTCGGLAGGPCPVNEYCDYQPSTCGFADGAGECTLIPQIGCPEYEMLTCGCDGSVYGNECEAAAAGVDIDVTGSCTPPTTDLFPCGAYFCNLATQYCQVQISDVGGEDSGFVCMPLPNGCAPTTDCACLAGESCGDMCGGNAADGLTLTCPGG